MVDEQEYEDDAGDPREADGGGDPGGLPGGRIPAPPIPRDEWVSQVVDDPSSGTQPVLLQGYVGDAADESRTRIYLDASLGTYVDVANDDVLHHQPLQGEREPSGGSMVWVRGDAQVSQGAGGAAAAAGADFFTGPVLEQNRQAGMGGTVQAATQMHITLLTVGGCISRFIACRPQHTALCTHRIICSYVCRDPLGGIGPVVTVHQQQGLRAQAPVGGDMTRMPCSAVDACPSALGCTSFQGCEPGPVVGPTGWQGCGQATHMIGCTGWQGCGQPHISLPGCVHTGTCPQAEAGPIGPTGWQGCGQPHISLPGCVQPTRLLGCTSYPGCGQPHISLPGCIHTGTCGTEQAAGPIGPTGWQGCGQPHISLPGCVHTGTCPQAEAQGGPIGPTGWQGCGQPHISLPGCVHTGTCPQAEAQGGPIGQTGWQGCGQATHLIGCTGYLGCGQPHISLPGCIHTGTCPQAEAVTGPGSTIATVCTQTGCPATGFGCPRTSTCPPTYTPGCGAEAGGLMQAAHGGGEVGGTSVATVCSQVGCPPHAAMGAEQGAASIPTGQYGPQCPTFGFTCTYVHCPPITIVTQGLGCPSTRTCPPETIVTRGFGCPRTSTCPPETIVTRGFGCPRTISCPPETIATFGFGCPPTSTCPPTGGYGCPRTSTCPPTYAPGCGGGGAEAAAGPYTRYQGCPTFGFTCTQFC